MGEEGYDVGEEDSDAEEEEDEDEEAEEEPAGPPAAKKIRVA